jgi:hypothetical protein
MLFSELTQFIQDKGSLAISTDLPSGHTLVQLLTDESDPVESLPQTLANSLILIQDGASLRSAIEQIDMYLEPSAFTATELLDLQLSSLIVLCELSQTYAFVHHGMFVFYVNKAGINHSCWSQANVRNRN